MNMQDRVMLQRWCASRASYNDVAHAPMFGLVENQRFTEKARRAYLLLWKWSAVRLSVWEQDKYTQRCGVQALFRRIERAKKIYNRIAAGNF